MSSFGHWKNEQAEEKLLAANAPEPPLPAAPTSVAGDGGKNGGEEGVGEKGGGGGEKVDGVGEKMDGEKGGDEKNDGEKGGDEKNDGEKGDGGGLAAPQVVEESPYHPPTELDPDTLQKLLSGAVPTTSYNFWGSICWFCFPLRYRHRRCVDTAPMF